MILDLRDEGLIQMSSLLDPAVSKDQPQSTSPGSRALEELGLKGLLVLIVGCLGFGLLLFSGVFIIPGYNEVLEGYVVLARLLKTITAISLAYLLNDRLALPLPLFIAAVLIQIILWVLYFLVPSGASFPLVYLQILSGFTFVIFLLGFIQFISGYPPHISCFALLTSVLLSHLFAFLPATLPSTNAPLLHAILLAIAIIFLCVCIKHRVEAEQTVNSADSEQLTIPPDDNHFVLFPLKDTLRDLDRVETVRNSLCAGSGVIILPFFYGILLEFSYVKNINSALSDQISELVVIAILLILLVITAFISRTFSLVRLFVVVMPFFTALLLISPLFWDNAPLSSSVFIRAVLSVYNTALWIYLARITFQKPRKRLAFFSLAVGILWLSVLLGQITGLNMLASINIDSGVIAGISLIAVWTLAMISVLLLLLFIRSHELLLEKNDSQDAPTLLDRIYSFSDTCGLSPRETEILIEFAHGRSASYIGANFFISEHTVKTHLRRIYSKAKVHNRQQLLNLIDASDR